nr:integrase, catalytic region, zinc finger, CCHC-type, peptidase aspartic, catalytic [Tanacetum cinerariifolium]
MTDFPQLDSHLAIPVFTPRDDPIACLINVMAFMSAVAALRFLSTNNQLRTSSNLRNQATIQDDKNYCATSSRKARTKLCIEAPSELPKVSLVNTGLKKLKTHLFKFNIVVKKRITPDAITEGLKSSTSTSRSKPSGNTKNSRILQTIDSNMKNKVEDLHRSVKSKLNKMNRVVEPICNADVKHSMLNANSELICATCNKCMFDAIHDIRVLDYVKDVNVRSKSAKSNKKKNIWKPTGKVFTEIGYRWKPTERTFTLVGNSCPITRITSTKVVPPKKTTSHLVETQKPEVKVYSRRPKQVKSVGSSKESRIANNSEPNISWGSNATDVPSSFSLVNDRLSRLFSGTVRFENDQIAKIMRYGDYQLGNVSVLRIAKDSLARGIPKLKFKKDHLCSTCALGKGKKSSHQPKTEDTNQEKLNLLHMDLCGPMRVDSINRNNEDLGKLNVKANIGIFVGYAFVKKTFRIYNRRTHKIMETIHVTFNELTSMASELFTSGPGSQFMTLGTLSSRLVPYHPSSIPYVPSTKNDWDILFQPMFYELLHPPPGVISLVPTIATQRPADPTGSPVSTLIDQGKPSSSNPSTQEQEQYLTISQGVEESLKTPHFHDDPVHETLHEDSNS